MSWILTRLVIGKADEVLGSFPRLNQAQADVRRRVGRAVRLAWRRKGDWLTTEGESFDVAYDITRSC